MRWASNHQILVGSRSREKGIALASRYLEVARKHYGREMSGSVEGRTNQEAASDAEIIVFTIPYQHAVEVAKALRSHIPKNSLVISPIVPMTKVSGSYTYSPYSVYDSSKNSFAFISAAEAISREIPSARVVSGFHTLPAKGLSRLEEEVNVDVLLASDDEEGVTTVSDLTKEIPGLRPLFAGPLAVSYLIESVTPLLLNISKNSKLKEPSVKIV